MGRKPFKSPDEKLAVVLSVLKGETTQVEVARRLSMSQTTIAKWQKQFLEGGRESLARGDNAVTLASRREMELAAQVDDLTTAIGEAYVELRVWRKGGALPAFEELELIRIEGHVSVRRFLARLRIPVSTWYHWRAAHLRGEPVRSWPAPVVDAIEAQAAEQAHRWSAWGHRKRSGRCFGPTRSATMALATRPRSSCTSSGRTRTRKTFLSSP